MASGSALMKKSGEDLLDSGLFSDAEISAGDKVWRVHKTILCTRSDYFKKAFIGQFAEAQTGKLEIRDQNPDIVYQVLTFLYTCHLPSNLSMTDLLELYKAADYFSIDNLQVDIIAELDRRFLDQSKRIWDPKGDADEAAFDIDINWTNQQRDEFFSVARIVYTDSPIFEKPRKSIIRFLKMSHVVLYKDYRFTNALKGIPELAVAIIKLMMDTENDGDRSVVCSSWPAKCYTCNKTASTYPYAQTWIAKDTVTRKFTVRGLCQRCARREED
ncbi:hypothetical protein PG997_010887 [Apiospora hydei]|uniref:BTB domain-containing protein n=1 Tax=Apiospora hydei TaxID=1337664 RepID=A0ABR1VL76_9PEZI